MTYPEYLKHAWSLYYKAVDSEGKERRYFLQQTKQVLENVPSGYGNRDDLLSRINSMLQEYNINILGKAQSKLFELDISDAERQRRMKKFLELYYQLRTKDEASLLGRLSLETRHRLHGLVLTIFKVKNWIRGLSYELIYNKRTPSNSPIIFAVTHVGKFDIEVVSEAIEDH